MVSPTRTASATRAAGPEPALRPARIEDCRRIAELFRISSHGIADYIWSRLQDDHPGQAPIEIGTQRYAEVDPVLRPYAELEASGSLYISALAVLPEWRGQGLGTRLLAAARERARTLGCPALSLICFAENGAARRLDQRHGFRVVDRPRRGPAPHDPCHRRGALDERARPLGHPAER